MPFDQSTRNLLARFVGEARTLLTEEFTRQLQQEYWLDPERGEVTDLDRLGYLDDARRATALLLRETLAYYLAGQPKPDAKARREALDRIVREQAFTILNRLCAVRMAEGRGLLIESVGQGHRSRGFQLYSHLAGTGLGETGDAYRCYLFSLFDELALELPVLFDRYAPEGRLFPREVALSQVQALINAPEIAPLWAEDETIGWIYQYFNSKEERQAMRAESGAPRNSRELAVRNQFFTPRYVVEFLTDNTLGRIWYEMTRGETSLRESCRYLVRRPTEIFLAEGEEAPQQDQPGEDLSQEELLRRPAYIPHRPLKDPRDILMLDPACGSLHFGLYAFDLYERIYDEAWELEGVLGSAAFVRSDGLLPLRESYPDKTAFLADVPRLIIERNIHGIDIDPRAVQIAGLSLWLRAQRSWQEQGIKSPSRPQIRRSNIVCAEPMPGDRTQLEEFLKSLRDDRLESLIRRVLNVPANQRVRATQAMADALCDLVRTVWKEMELAGEAGSLLKIEEALADAVARGKAEWDERMPLFRVAEFRLTDQNTAKPTIRYYKTIPGEQDTDFWERAEALVLAALEEHAGRGENGGGYRRRLFAGDAVRGFAFIDLARKRYDVTLTNPPFGESTEKTKSFVKYHYPNAYQDIAYAFTQRSVRLTPTGHIGAITTRTGFFLTSLSAWREETLDHLTRLNVCADLGYGVLDALVETAAYVLTPAKKCSDIAVYDLLQDRHKEAVLRETVEHGGRRLHLTSASRLASLPGAPLAYWAPQELISAYELCDSFEPRFGVVKRGVATGDNSRFLRLFWEVPPQSIGGDRQWIWYAKGGEYSPYFIPTRLVLKWHENGNELRNFEDETGRLRSRPQNLEYFRKSGLAYASRTTSGFGPRILPADHGFDQTSNPIFLDCQRQSLSMLALLMTRPVLAFVELAVGGGDTSQAGTAARDYTNGLVGRIPIPSLGPEDQATLTNIAAEIVTLLRERAAFDETAPEFHRSTLACPSGKSLMSAIRTSVQHQLKKSLRILELSAIADSISSTAFRLSAEAQRFLDEYIGFHPWEYERVGGRSFAGMSPVRQVTKKCYWADQGLEAWSHEQKRHPERAADDNDFIEQRVQAAVRAETERLLSFVIGVSFGRWDLAVTNREISLSRDVLAPLPNLQPACLGHENAALGKGILTNDNGQVEDIVSRCREALAAIWPDSVDLIEQEASHLLETDSLRAYLTKSEGFFGDHLRLYTSNGRQAPVYWPLSTPSGSYTLWLYYHRLSDQILYSCVNDFVDPKLKQVTDDAGRLRQKRGRSSAEEKALEQLAGLELELTDFRAELLRIATFWKPNLNDGVQITAAPLWRLFQHRSWQKTLKETWESLERGEYDWAHLAMSIWPERVVPKCVTDRSLAIAHDVEDLFWVEDGGRWRNLNPPEVEIAEQKRRQQRPGRDQLRSGLAALTLGEGRGLRCEQVYESLATGRWDDLTPALLLWPERVAEKAWYDPLLAQTLKIDVPTKRTKAARERFIAERVSAGCPDLADALREALADRVDRFASLWAELARGDRDELALALALWPERVVDTCAKDVELAERHGLRRFWWVQDGRGGCRRRRALGQEIEGEIHRRVA